VSFAFSVTSTTGGLRAGCARKAHGRSPRAGAAIALARGLPRQPEAPISAIQAPPAAATLKKLRRVILLPKAEDVCLRPGSRR